MKRIMCMCLLLACSSRPDVTPGSLVVTPTPATFRELQRGESEVLQTLFLKNRSDGPLEIQQVELSELDENQEMQIVSIDEWTNVTLGPNEERSLQVVWRPTDTLVDQGRVEISIVGQLPLAVPITSPEVPSFCRSDNHARGHCPGG